MLFANLLSKFRHSMGVCVHTRRVAGHGQDFRFKPGAMPKYESSIGISNRCERSN
jgi:hypothetical protein